MSETDHYRRESMGAFAHEIRTPLTSIRMVIELAKRLGSGDQAVLDAELSAMLNASIDDLQRLADDLQEIRAWNVGRWRWAGGRATWQRPWRPRVSWLAPACR
ncbi:MAG: hypothetical protein HS107_12470 [Thermoflexaceae bacterium]|nr:hypothetical protein [Thermoflexaceae bacterium]